LLFNMWPFFFGGSDLWGGHWLPRCVDTNQQIDNGIPDSNNAKEQNRLQPAARG
ncbi:hypothetical protein BaRGS_00021303, partial [Batillaria attramentaria]